MHGLQAPRIFICFTRNCAGTEGRGEGSGQGAAEGEEGRSAEGGRREREAEAGEAEEGVR